MIGQMEIGFVYGSVETRVSVSSSVDPRDTRIKYYLKAQLLW